MVDISGKQETTTQEEGLLDKLTGIQTIIETSKVLRNELTFYRILLLLFVDALYYEDHSVIKASYLDGLEKKKVLDFYVDKIRPRLNTFRNAAEEQFVLAKLVKWTAGKIAGSYQAVVREIDEGCEK